VAAAPVAVVSGGGVRPPRGGVPRLPCDVSGGGRWGPLGWVAPGATSRRASSDAARPLRSGRLGGARVLREPRSAWRGGAPAGSGGGGRGQARRVALRRPQTPLAPTIPPHFSQSIETRRGARDKPTRSCQWRGRHGSAARGARHHSVELPWHLLTAQCGPSGRGPAGALATAGGRALQRCPASHRADCTAPMAGAGARGRWASCSDAARWPRWQGPQTRGQARRTAPPAASTAR
jgi:hypothetical protein